MKQVLPQLTEIEICINNLITKFPEKFNNLVELTYECSKDTDVIAYNIKDDIVLFNENIFNDADETESSFAFISLLIANKDEYCNVPEGISSKSWNVAVHLKIVDTLNSIGEFIFPQDIISYKVDTTGTIAEIVQRMHTNSDFKEILEAGEHV